ncbi:MAG: ATP-binding cassette domain-containing protein [Spirochaetota bacterium]
MDAPTISLRAVTKRFTPGGPEAVSDLSLDLHPGVVVGILGENGAGKSTTLNMIATLLRPSRGTIRLMGHEVTEDPLEVRRRIGILFGSQGGLYGRLTGRENIEYFGALQGMKRREARARAGELVSLLGMEEYADRRVSTYSTGMKQRTSLGRCIVHDPPVLLLDEPTAGLDLSAASVVHRFVRRWAGEGKTVLFSSHHMDEILSLCDRAVVLHRGSLALDRRLSRDDPGALDSFRLDFTRLVEDSEASREVRR